MVSAITQPCPTQSGRPLHGRSSDLRFALLSEPSHPGKVVELTIQELKNSGIEFAKPGQSLPCAAKIPQFLNPSIP